MPFRASWTQRMLADELAALRAAKGLTHREVAKATQWSTAKISRAENAMSKIEPADVRELARLYGVSDVDTERLCEMARDSRGAAWWSRYEQWLSASLIDFLGYEDEATRAWVAQSMVVPGLLQTKDYASCMYNSGPPEDPDRIDAELAVRVRRQRRLTESNPLDYIAMVGESVLHWAFGGSQVLHEQLDHLRVMVELPNVRIRVVPFAQPAQLHPLNMFELGVRGYTVAFSETLWSTPLHESQLEIRRAHRAIERLKSVALTEEETKALIERRIKETKT